MATRRNGRDRVFGDRSTGTGTDSSTGGYDTAGDDEATVVNVSGHPSAQPLPRDHASMPHVSPRPGRRRPVEVDATSSERLDDGMQRSLTGAVLARGPRHLTDKETVERSDPHVRAAYLDHVFGLNLPGRDRA